jgi:hypothetical protein
VETADLWKHFDTTDKMAMFQASQEDYCQIVANDLNSKHSSKNPNYCFLTSKKVQSKAAERFGKGARSKSTAESIAQTAAGDHKGSKTKGNSKAKAAASSSLSVQHAGAPASTEDVKTALLNMASIGVTEDVLEKYSELLDVFSSCCAFGYDEMFL